MPREIPVFRGCFLGMAIGDAMGYTVEELSLREIRAEYGPDGLLGYDLRNGSAEVTSYTQVAAYVANALLIHVTRGKPGNQIQYVSAAMREWVKRQHFPRDPAKSVFWVSQIPELRRKFCRDARMMDAMRQETLGTPEKPINSAATPGAILAGAAVGMAFDPARMDPKDIGRVAMQSVALTHGDPEAFLSAAVLAYTVAGLIQAPEEPLKNQFAFAIDAVQALYGKRFPKANDLAEHLRRVMDMAFAPGANPVQDMEILSCRTAGQCLAGAVYACLSSRMDFDTAMITAVNHSGRSAAVAAVTGAIMGLLLTEEKLPEFYVESLAAAKVLRTLADDLAQGSPTRGLFDDSWDHKYTQGLPL